MLKRIALCLTLCFSTSTFAQLESLLEDSTPRKPTIWDRIGRLDLNFSLRLFKFDIADGFQIAAKYKYEAEPSYIENLHTRVDRWEITAGFNAGDLLDDLPIFLSLDRRAEITFVRHFKDKKKAITTKPYSPLRLPLTAERALEKIEAGDFVTIPVRLNLATGLYVSTTGTLDAGARVYKFIAGDFIINVFRMKDNKVRLRLASQSQDGTGISGGAELDISYFGVSAVDSTLGKIIDLDLIDAGYTKSKGKQYLVDYIFDLNDPDARDAYDDILSSTLKFRNLKVVKAHLKKKNLESVFVSNLLKAEALADADFNSDKKRVERLFKGFNNFERKGHSMKMRIAVLSVKNHSITAKNNLTFIDRERLKKYYYYGTHIDHNNFKLGVKPWRIEERKDNTLFSFAETTSRGQSTKNNQMGVFIDHKDRYFRSKEYSKISDYLKANIPEQVRREIKWNGWEEALKRNNFRFYFRVLLSDKVLDNLPDITVEQYKTAVEDYIEKVGEIENLNYVSDEDDVSDDAESLYFLRDFIKERRIRKFVKYSYKALFDNSINGRQRTKLILELKSNKIMRAYGMGFISSLLPQDKLKDLIFINLNLVADLVPAVHFKFGKEENVVLLERLESINRILSNRSYDIRYMVQNYEGDWTQDIGKLKNELVPIN